MSYKAIYVNGYMKEFSIFLSTRRAYSLCQWEHSPTDQLVGVVLPKTIGNSHFLYTLLNLLFLQVY